ncbi:PhzF family phenazine biosynthesis protein [Paenibacillus cremeus]|uniref:PhzF family phenazine biosynthesis protein n=1 Tax=Paenibacillus cremeus TaxID=2163881 RepID=A0A559JPQ5_9BACL|nr:PhzF family phenazine biosynthesis protein [Paenibacillus cremeus]TVY01857.1 PhzF family phenazine biosynthesis protein [Paenibacillus cremeus]
MTIIHIVDAFADRPFRGNPAAVCLLERYPSDAVMQQIAMEMNLSETAFLCPCPEEGEHHFQLRWFTPVTEVDLCGHATLASAHYLWDTGAAPLDRQLSFHTRSGLLTAKPSGDGWIQLDFPAEPVSEVEVNPDRLIAALGGVSSYRFVGTNRMDMVVELDSEETVRSLTPDFTAIRGLTGLRGLVVTARSSNPAYDFVSRCFFPGLGIDEDPVTGSTHCGLAPYWQPKLGRDQFIAKQLSGRTGTLRLAIAGDRVKLSGQAVTVLNGALQL